MSKNIGFTKKFAEYLAKSRSSSIVEAYVQKEEHFWTGGKYQFIVVLQKRVRHDKSK